jgi:hypothetical protein
LVAGPGTARLRGLSQATAWARRDRYTAQFRGVRTLIEGFGVRIIGDHAQETLIKAPLMPTVTWMT